MPELGDLIPETEAVKFIYGISEQDSLYDLATEHFQRELKLGTFNDLNKLGMSSAPQVTFERQSLLHLIEGVPEKVKGSQRNNQEVKVIYAIPSTESSVGMHFFGSGAYSEDDVKIKYGFSRQKLQRYFSERDTTKYRSYTVMRGSEQVRIYPREDLEQLISGAK